MYVALCADLISLLGGGLGPYLDHKIGEDNAIAVGTCQGEGNAVCVDTCGADGLRCGRGGVFLAVVHTEGKACSMCIVGKTETILLDGVSVGSGDGVGGRTSSAGHELDVVAGPVHVVYCTATELQLRCGIALPHVVPILVGGRTAIKITVGLVDGVVYGTCIRCPGPRT